jgi:hypothetical protein
LTNGQSGIVEFDVTADIQQFLTAVSPNYGWVIKKTNEGQAGRVHFASRESANGPRLLITVAP